MITMTTAISGKIDLNGQVALVTGAARGIGKAVALALAREGADLIVSDLLDTGETEQAIKGLHRKVLGLKCNVSQKMEVSQMIHLGIQQFGKIDIAVHSAGLPGGRQTNFLDLSEEEWDHVIDINLKGTFLVIQAVLPHMKERKSGKIVCIGSLAAKIGSVNSGPHYVASKGGIHALVKWASVNAAGSSVFVNGIAPGPVQTTMIEGLNYPDSLLPLKRLGEPEDIAEAALFLASQASNWMTGIVLDVNGGFFIG
jgi:3-oxoacyl-[acyl-carrier protein] reductase